MNTQHVLIETLTPLHVGSGRLLQGNTEYLYFSAAGTVALVDERKVLDLIGEENLDQWLRIIENEQDLLDYIRKRRPTLSPADVARRVIRVVGTKTPQKWHREGRERFPTIREQLFSGNGQPILPGSSLKGAIRTAVLNALIQQIPTAARTITAFKTVDEREDYRSGQLKRLIKYKGGTLEKKYAGPDPNHDVFRFLRIGDAHFEETVCLLSETLNERGNGTFEMKDEVKQFLECIPKGAEALCRVQIPAELKARLNEPRYRETAGKIPHRDRIEWPRLLADINANTKRLIEKEQRRYQSQSLPDEASAYLETLGELTKNLQPNQCVLRVGFGTGYLNMTGGWAEEQWRETLTPEKFKEEMLDLAREVRHDKRGKYDHWSQVLPKSRKMALSGVPLGFLKLTVFSEREFADWQAQATDRLAQKQQQAEAQQIVAEATARAAAEAEAQRAEADRLAAEEARKPKWFEGTLPKGKTVEVEAEVVKSGRPNTVKVYVKGYETRTFPLTSFTNPIEVGTPLVVKAMTKNDGTIYQVNYARHK